MNLFRRMYGIVNLGDEVYFKHRFPRREIAKVELELLKIKIRDRLENSNYDCVFKPERKVKKEGAMQFKIKVTNSKGENVCSSTDDDADLTTFYSHLCSLWASSPEGICFEIMIARPDPEVVAIKQKLYDVLNEAFLNGVEMKDVPNRLFDHLDIKLKRKDNA